MIQIGNDKIKDIYVGSDKIKEVYHGSDLVWRGVPPVEPITLFESNMINVGFVEGLREGQNSWVQIGNDKLVANCLSGGVATVVSSSKYDITGYTYLSVTFENTGSNKYSWASLFPSQDTHYYYGYEGSDAASGVINVPIDWFPQEPSYIAIGARADSGYSQVEVTKIELI